MIVQSEPNGMLMVRYKLYFDPQSPDPEDAWVLAYLEEHGLVPRRELTETHDGVSYKILHFGQCYLRGHLAALGELYKRGYEHSALTQHVRIVLHETDDAAVRDAVSRLNEAALQAAAVALTEPLHQQARFEVSEDNVLHVLIDAATVTQAFLALQST